MPANDQKAMVFSFSQPESVAITVTGVLSFDNNKKKNLISKIQEDFKSFEPIKSSRMDLKYLQERVGQSRTILPPILLIGCGSVGSYILPELVNLGAVNIGISDPDEFISGNALRHYMAIIISHSSFSNDQSAHDSSIVSGYSVKEKDINLVNHMARHNIVDAIRIQDTLIEEALNDCDKSTELFYYGIAHIPLIFRAGFQVGDEGKVRLLHKYRNDQPLFKEVSSDPDNCTVMLETSTRSNTKASREMLVVIA